MKKRSLALMMTAVLAAGLAACGGSKQAPKAGESAAQTEEKLPQTEPVSAEESQTLQTETETKLAEGPSEKEIADAYLQILLRDEARIRSYDWQNDWGYGGEGRQIAIHDVNGDEIPELIYVMIPEGKDGAMYMGDLHIYTYEADEKEAEELYDQESWDVAVAGGTRYCLFLEEDGSFYAYTSFGDDNWTNLFSRFSMKGEDDMILSAEMKRFDHWNETDTGRVQEYTGAEDQEIEEAEYESRRMDLAEHMAVCLLQGNLDDKDLQGAAERAGDVSMTYDEAVQYLQGTAGEKQAQSIDAGQTVAEDSGAQGLLPESSQRLLTSADIAGMSDDDIQLAINTIYARHGYRFKDQELLAYFSGFDWYQPSYSDMETVKDTFSDIEEDNVEFLADSLD